MYHSAYYSIVNNTLYAPEEGCLDVMHACICLCTQRKNIVKDIHTTYGCMLQVAKNKKLRQRESWFLFPPGSGERGVGLDAAKKKKLPRFSPKGRISPSGRDVVDADPDQQVHS